VTEGERIDPVTGERRGWFPLYLPLLLSDDRWKRIARSLLQIPFGMAAGIILAAVLTLIFAVEVFMSEVYNGPFKQFLVFTPTVLFSTLVPTFSGIYTRIAKSLTNFENHRTDQGYENSMTRKIFVLNFLTGYMSLFLTAYVYGRLPQERSNLVPFGSYIVPKLDFFQIFLPKSIDEVKEVTPRTFSINAFRLKRQLIYFAVTAQIVGFAMENFLPYVTRKVFSEARKITNKDDQDVAALDRDEEKAFLERVREEADLPEYDLYTDYVEMVVQVDFLSVTTDNSTGT
jgi:anoctamin-10